MLSFNEPRHDKTNITDAQAGLDPCWSQTNYVGFVKARLKYKSLPKDHILQSFRKSSDIANILMMITHELQNVIKFGKIK
jgi:hypothetical protein